MKLTKRALRKLIKEEFKTAKLAEIDDELPVDDKKERMKLAATRMGSSKRGAELKQRGKTVTSGEDAANFTRVENSLLQQIEGFFTDLAGTEGVELQKYRVQIQAMLQKIQAIVKV